MADGEARMCRHCVAFWDRKLALVLGFTAVESESKGPHDLWGKSNDMLIA